MSSVTVLKLKVTEPGSVKSLVVLACYQKSAANVKLNWIECNFEYNFGEIISGR